MKFEFVYRLLHDLHGACSDSATPLSLVPLDILSSDDAFMESTRCVSSPPHSFEFSCVSFLTPSVR